MMAMLTSTVVVVHAYVVVVAVAVVLYLRDDPFASYSNLVWLVDVDVAAFVHMDHLVLVHTVQENSVA